MQTIHAINENASNQIIIWLKFIIRRFPFDWRNPVGFAVAMLMQYIMFMYGARIGCCVFCLAIRSYLYGIALSRVIKGNLFAINRSTQAEAEQSQTFKQLVKFLDLHSSAQQLGGKTKSTLSTETIHSFSVLQLCLFQSDQQFFGHNKTFCDDSVCMEFDHNLRSNANGSNRISWVIASHSAFFVSKNWSSTIQFTSRHIVVKILWCCC